MDLAQELARRLDGVDRVCFSLLFGSRATGAPRPDSDIDLGVFFDERLSAEERFRLRLELAGALADLGRPDVVVLNDAPPLLGHRALAGRLLTARDRTSYVRYFVKTLAASNDEAPWRRLHRRRREQRLREGRFG